MSRNSKTIIFEFEIQRTKDKKAVVWDFYEEVHQILQSMESSLIAALPEPGSISESEDDVEEKNEREPHTAASTSETEIKKTET